MSCPKNNDYYIDPAHATRFRVFLEWTSADEDCYAIDAACEHGGYTEECWTHDNATGDPIDTLARAIELTQAFAREVAPHLVGTKPRVPASLLA